MSVPEIIRKKKLPEGMPTHGEIGKLEMSAEGLRKIANAMDTVYGKDVVLNIACWREFGTSKLFLSLTADSGPIDLVSGE